MEAKLHDLQRQLTELLATADRDAGSDFAWEDRKFVLENASRVLEVRLKDIVASGQRRVLDLEDEIRGWKMRIEELSEEERLVDGGGLHVSMDA